VLPPAQELKGVVALGVAASVVIAFLDAALAWPQTRDLPSLVLRTVYWLAVGAFLGLLLGLLIGFVRAGRRSVTRSGPRALWRQDAYATATAAVAFGAIIVTVSVVYGLTDMADLFTAGFVAARLEWEAATNVVYLALWFAVWPLAAMVVSEVGRFGVATTLAWIRGRGPLRLLRFLEDARERQIIRQAGTVYGFRHARLQSRLAQTLPDRSRTRGAPVAGDPAARARATGPVG
jgi:hypothetical protein